MQKHHVRSSLELATPNEIKHAGERLAAVYGIEQQAEIVKHAFWLRHGGRIAGIADKGAYDALVRFDGATL